MTRTRAWLGVAVAAGIAYVVIGRVFAWPTTHIIAWRYAAWAASFAVAALHIRYERGTGTTGRTLAAHVALGAALGGFFLAIAAIAFRLQTGAEVIVATWAISLVAWPAITGIPAFIAALVIDRVLPKSPK
jgi:hypothetical protein